MIGPPLNDFECLSRYTAFLRAQLGPELAQVARRYGSTAELAEDLRRRPQLNDVGQAPAGVPVIACDVPQRTFLNSPMPNCWERAGTYVVLAEYIDPAPFRQLATANTPIGRHTIALENGAWVVLDPYLPTGTTQSPTRNAMPYMGSPQHIILPTSTATDAHRLLSWLVNVAESTAAEYPAPLYQLAIAHARYVLERFGLLVGTRVALYDDCERIPGQAHDCSLVLEDVQLGTPPDGARARRDIFLMLAFGYYGALATWGPAGVAPWQQAVYLLATLGLVGDPRRNAAQSSGDALTHELEQAIRRLRSSFKTHTSSLDQGPRAPRAPASDLLDPYPAPRPAEPRRTPLELIDPYSSSAPAPQRPALDLLDPYANLAARPAPRMQQMRPAALTVDDLAQKTREEEDREGDVGFMRALDWVEQQRRKRTRNCGCSSSAPLGYLPLRNVSGQDVFEIFHQVGKTVLGLFGMGSVGDLVGQGWSAAGIRPKDAGSGSLGEAISRVSKPRAQPAAASSTQATQAAPGDLVDETTLSALLSQPNVAKLVKDTGVTLDAPTLSRLLSDPAIPRRRITGEGGKIDPAKVNALLANPLVASVVSGRLKQLRNAAAPVAAQGAPMQPGELLTVNSLGG
jgi:hypothetical protein